MIERRQLAMTRHIVALSAYLVPLTAFVGYVLWVRVPGVVQTAGEEPPANFELNLLVVIAAVGALGGLLHAINSFTTYIGNGKFVGSWVPWYVARPVVGALLAVIFYAVVRGGLLTSSGATPQTVNVYGLLALAGLVGLFSDRATQKLKEIFEAAFVTSDVRAHKLHDEVRDQVESGATPTGDIRTLLRAAAGTDAPHDHAPALKLESMMPTEAEPAASDSSASSTDDRSALHALLRKAADDESASGPHAETLTRKMKA